MTAEILIGKLWRMCLMSAREAGHAPAEGVQRLIKQTREILAHYGCTKQLADSLLFDLVHGDSLGQDQPTDRIFEALLEIELSEFFAERGLTA